MNTHRSVDQKKTLRQSGSIILILASLFSAFMLIGTVLSGAVETSASPESIDLSSYNRTAGPVTFIHKDHGSTGETKPACADCHHTTAWDQVPEKCSVCHLPLDSTAAPTDDVAFHKLCIGCHKAQIEQGNKRLTLACDSCHHTNGAK